MPVAIERFEVVPEAEQPQRSAAPQTGGSATVPPAKLAREIEETLRLRESRRARLRAT